MYFYHRLAPCFPCMHIIPHFMPCRYLTHAAQNFQLKIGNVHHSVIFPTTAFCGITISKTVGVCNVYEDLLFHNLWRDNNYICFILTMNASCSIRLTSLIKEQKCHCYSCSLWVVKLYLQYTSLMHLVLVIETFSPKTLVHTLKQSKDKWHHSNLSIHNDPV